MANRWIRSCREIISSAILFTEAKAAHSNGCVATTYFSTYYSLFHAMWAVVLLNSDLDDIERISHEKLKNLFIDHYIRHGFLDTNVEKVILESRNMREFYSYNIPNNMAGALLDFCLIEDILLKCYQLANLHSWILTRETKVVRCTDKNKEFMTEQYFLYNGREDRDGRKIKDPSEDGCLREIHRKGLQITNYEDVLGHEWDEIGYSNWIEGTFDRSKVYNIRSAAFQLIYKAIPYI